MTLTATRLGQIVEERERASIILSSIAAVDFIAHPASEEDLRRAVAYIRDHWQRRYGLVTVG